MELCERRRIPAAEGSQHRGPGQFRGLPLIVKVAGDGIAAVGRRRGAPRAVNMSAKRAMSFVLVFVAVIRYCQTSGNIESVKG